MKKFTEKLNESVEDKKVPTAEEVFKEYHGFEADHSSSDIIDLMIEFAKIHVEAALKEASEKAKVQGYSYDYESNSRTDLDVYGAEMNVDGVTDCDTGLYVSTNKESILNAYPIENIK
jgi:hypothetical protein